MTLWYPRPRVATIGTCIALVVSACRGRAQSSHVSQRDSGVDGSALAEPAAPVVRPVQLAIGPSVSFARMSDGSLRCWGACVANAHGKRSMIPLGRPAHVRDVGAARGWACAVLENGAVECWGRDAQVRGSGANDDTPIRVYGVTEALAVAVGDRMACARLANSVKCWRRGSASDTLGPMGTLPGATTVRDLDGARTLSVGGDAACAIDAKGVPRCWGGNPWRNLGPSGPSYPPRNGRFRGSFSERAVRLPRGDAGTLRDVVTNGTSTWMLDSDGSLQGLGRTALGLVGSQGTSSCVDGLVELGGVVEALSGATSGGCREMPMPIATRAHVVAIAPGTSHVCVLDNEGAVWCWGDGTHGQLGDGKRSTHETPTRIVDIEPASAIASNGNATCVIGRSGKVWCWGESASRGDDIVPALVE